MKKCHIIYADPPWDYMRPTRKAGSFNRLRTPYPTLSTAQLCHLPVQSIAHTHCVLFLWTTDAALPGALQVIKAWGFSYKTVAFVWSKRTKSHTPHHAWGHWTLKNTEQCLLATRGTPNTLFKKSNTVRQLVEAPRREHSRKPDDVRERIVDLLGDIPRVELFARQKAPGWDVWGNALPNDIELIKPSQPATEA